MEESWADQDRVRSRRRRVRIVLAAALVVLFASAVSYLRTPRDSERLGSLPGLRANERQDDDTPFVPAQAENASDATTLPEAFFDAVDSALTTTTTTTVPQTTTTLPIPGPQDDPICQALVDLVAFARSAKQGIADPSAYAAQVIERMDVWIPLLQSLDANLYGAAISRLDQVRTQLRSGLSEGELSSVMSDLLVPDPTSFGPLISHIQSVCPSVRIAP